MYIQSTCHAHDAHRWHDVLCESWCGDGDGSPMCMSVWGWESRFSLDVMDLLDFSMFSVCECVGMGVLIFIRCNRCVGFLDVLVE